MERLNYRVPPATIYETIRKIKGKPSRKVNILQDNNQIYSSIPEIEEKLAATFSKISSDGNYDPESLAYKREAEQERVHFESNNNEHYNRPFTLTELEYHLSVTKNTAPGEDRVHYQMLKRMPEHAKIYLCNIYNRMWHETFSPNQWNTVIPIQKSYKQRKL